MNRIVTSLLVTVVLASTAGIVRAADPDSLASAPPTLAQIARDLQSAVNAGESAALLEVCGRAQTLAATETNSADAQYWLALASWRTVPALMREQKDKAQRRCAAGLAAADRTLALDPNRAEALAIKAGLQGLSLTAVPGTDVMTIGPEIEKEFGQALGLAPNNPRVQLLEAMNTLHKPAFVGGGADRALPKFQKAIALFEAGADSSGPSWGRDDAYLWAGRSAMQLKDYAAARDYYTKALAANSDNHWVKFVLLPEAERALAAPPAAKSKS